MTPTLPPLPRFILPFLRLAYEAHFLVITLFRSVLTVIYYNPLFQSRCASFGRNVTMEGLPYVTGHTQIHVGNGVGFGGKISIVSGRIYNQPTLILQDRCGLNWNTTIVVNREVVIEEDAWITPGVRISDSDGHPREMDLRLSGVPPDPKDCFPVRIGRGAWIGTGSYIMKGVTIGEGAIIGANSVVISNVPPYALALGNPAEVLIRNFGLPTTMRKKRRTEDPAKPSPGYGESTPA